MINKIFLTNYLINNMNKKNYIQLAFMKTLTKNIRKIQQK